MNAQVKQYALERLTSLLDSHRAAVESMRIVANSASNFEQLVAALQVHHAFRARKRDNEFEERAAQTVLHARDLIASNFPHHRGMFLVSLCGLRKSNPT